MAKQYQPTEAMIADMTKQDHLLGLPEGTTFRQIKQESGFNPNALSKAGAMGYAQVTPKTLSTIQDRVGRDLSPASWADSLVIHREVMKENLSRWGNPADALRAYNSGWEPSKWNNPETNEYVETILGPGQGGAAMFLPQGGEEKLGAYGKALKRLEDSAAIVQPRAAELGVQTEGSASLTQEQSLGFDEQAAAELARRSTQTSGFWEAAVAAATEDTLTSAIIDLNKRGLPDPAFNPFTEDRRQALEAEGLYGDQTARDHIGASVNEEDFNARVQSERERIDLQRRMANTEGLSGAGVIAGAFIGSMADPVAIIGSMGAGAAVAAVRGAGAASRAAMVGRAALGGAVENVATQEVIDQIQGTRFDWASMGQQAAFGAGFGALGGVLAARTREEPVAPVAPAEPSAVPEVRPVEEVDPLDSYMQGSQDELEAMMGRQSQDAYDAGQSGAGKDPLEDGGIVSTDLYDMYGHIANEGDDGFKLGFQNEVVSHEADKVRDRGDDISEEGAGVRAEEREMDGQEPPADVPVFDARIGSGATDPETVSAFKSGHAELDRMATKSTDPLIRQLAARLREALKWDVGIEVWTKKKFGQEKTRSHYDLGSHTVRIVRGESDSVILHELAHAATALKMRYGKANPDSIHGQLFNQLEALRTATKAAWDALTPSEQAKRMIAKREDLIKRDLPPGTKVSDAKATQMENTIRANQNVDYYFQNADEYVAGLYTGENAFIDFLSELTVPATGQNFLTKAVQIIKDFLGLTNVETNALVQAMRITDQIMSSPLNVNLSGGRWEDLPRGVMMAPPTPAGVLNTWTTTALQQKVLDALGRVNITRNASKAAEGLLSGLGYVDKRTGGWLVTPAQRLSQSASTVARRAGALLFENAAGTDARNSSVSINYERLRRGYTDAYLEDIEKNLIEAMTPREKARYLTGFGAKAGVERIDTLVATERAKKRNAVQAGSNYQYPPTPIGRIAAVMDEQVRRVTDEGIKVGNQYAKDVSGGGWAGFMPQVWKWDKFASANSGDRKVWDALRKNFTEQYTEQIIDPAIQKALQAGANSQELAAIRAALTKQIEAKVETRMGEAIRDPQTRGNRDDTKFAKIAAELLDEQFAGQPVTGQVVADFRKALGDIVKDRARTEFDMLRSVDGVRLLDYVDHSIVESVQHIGHRFAGQNAMARAGLKDPHYFDALMDLAAKDGASQADMEDLAFAGRAFGFMPSIAQDAPAMSALRNFAYASMMGKLGFSQLADVGAIASNLGVGSMFRTLSRTVLREPALVKQLGRMSLSLVGQDYRLHRLTADVLPDGRAMSGGLQSLQVVSNRAAQLVSHLSLSNFMNKTLHKAFLPTMMEDLTRAVSGKDGGMSARRLADAGIDDVMAGRIKAMLDANDAGRKAGDAFNWDQWADTEAMDSFIEAAHRITYQTFQRSLIGEAQAWRSESQVGVLFGQFRGFGLTAMEKSTARNLNILDAQALVGLALSTALGAAMAYGRIEMATLGMSDAKARAYRKKQQEGFTFTKLVLNNVNQSGLLTDVVTIGELVFGGNSRGQQQGFAPPVLGLVGAAGQAVGQAGAFLTGEGDVKKLSQSILRIAPGGNTYMGTFLLNQSK